MRLTSLDRSSLSGTDTLRVTVEFEDIDRAPAIVRFDTVSGAGDRGARVEPFVATAAVIADLLGERRLAVEAPVDPRLTHGVTAALQLFRSWWPEPRPPLVIETVDRVPAARPTGTACCLTGGIDSTGLLLDNHRRYPRGHPMRIITGVAVYGLDESTAGDIHAPDPFVQQIAERTGIETVAVSTDLRSLEPSVATWTDRIQAAVLTGAAHAALHHVGDLLVAPRHDAANLSPWGTHRALDHHFGTTELRVHHEYTHASRHERTRAIADDGELVPFIQVCNRSREHWGPETWNCGRCEKCLRTMVSFRAAGVDELPSFATGRVEPDMVDALPAERTVPGAWLATAGLLRDVGEAELADAVDRFIARCRRRQRLRELRALPRRLRDGTARIRGR